MRKYDYLHVLQGNYGYGDGFEDLCTEDNYREIRARLREYNENEAPYIPVSYRTIQRRELRSR